MKIVEVHPEHPEAEPIAEAARILRSGGVVAFPTETVYGLGGNALDPAAIARIYAAKGRPAYNPLIVHCADVESARELAAEWPAAADRLAEAFWPGPLTLVVRKSEAVPSHVTAGLGTVALRVPSHPVARALLTAAAFPIAAPSANLSFQVSPTTGAHVVKGLADRVDLLLDGGPAPVGIESSVVDVSGPTAVLLRPGTIHRRQLEEVLGAAVEVSAAGAGTAPRPAPGMLDRHYSPRAELVLVPRGDRLALVSQARIASVIGASVGALLYEIEGSGLVDRAIPMPADPDGYAQRLYASLHDLDDDDVDLILVEEPPATPEWAGVRDRLRRAASDPSPPGVPFDRTEP